MFSSTSIDTAGPSNGQEHHPQNDKIKYVGQFVREIDPSNAGEHDNTAPNEFAQIQQWSAEHRRTAERALVRKIDWRLLPAVIIMYIMNYLDRVC